MKSKKIKKQTSSNTSFKYEICILISIIFFFPFFKGLFFEKEFYTASIIISILALGIFIKNIILKEKMSILTPAEYFAHGFILIYIISFLFSINKHLASFEALKNMTYLIVFIIAVGHIKSKHDIDIINKTLLLSGIVVAFIGFGTALGSFFYTDAFKDGMMNSTFQYHNTFGAFMSAALFLAMGEIGSTDNWKKYVLIGMSYIFSQGLIFSYSRGAWILMPFIGLLALLLLKEEGLKKVVTSFIAILLSLIITTGKVYENIQIQNQAVGWILFILGVLISVALAYLFDKLLAKVPSVHIKKKIVFVVVLMIIVLVMGLFTSGYLVKVLPESMAQRVMAINTKTFTVVERGVFYTDALNIIKDYPILGTGGGGWETLYSQYKTYDYYTTEAHNYIMQVWIETGIIGITLLVGLYLSILWMIYKIKKNVNDSNLWNKLLGIFCAIFALVLHSFIDFDMTFGAYAVTLWLLFGIVTAAYKIYVRDLNRLKINIKIPFYIVPVFLLLIVSICFRVAMANKSVASTLASQGQYHQALAYMEDAVNQYPFEAEYLMYLSELQFILGNSNDSRDFLDKAQSNIERALNREKSNIKILNYAIKYYIQIEDYEKAIIQAEKLLQYHPLDNNTYKTSIEICYSAGKMLLEKKEVNKAEPYFDRILKIEQRVNEINERLEIDRERLLQDVKDIPEEYVKAKFQINLDDETMQKIDFAKKLIANNDY